MTAVNYFGILPKHNPVIGTFHHAPVASNVSSKYFQREVMSLEEYKARKALRQNPFTGQFHPGPQLFSEYHGLGKFKQNVKNCEISDENESTILNADIYLSPSEDEEMKHSSSEIDFPACERFGAIRQCKSFRCDSNNSDLTRMIRRCRSLSEERHRLHSLEEIVAECTGFYDDGEERPRFFSLKTDDCEFREVVPDVSNEGGNRWLVNRVVTVTQKYAVDMTPHGNLGKGAYSCVKIATHRLTNCAYALKIMRKKLLVTKEELGMVKREVEIHQVLRHPHIVQLHEIFEDDMRLFLVLEKATGGTLENVLLQHRHKWNENVARHFMKQILEAVHYLHQNGVLQGDLKPSNILFANDENRDKRCPITDETDLMSLQVKICDFGLSCKVPNVKYYKYTGDVHKVPYSTICGTMGYIAPEILKKESYTISADMWSCGIILYEMLGGIPPWVTYSDCLKVPLEFPNAVFSHVNSEAIDLVRKLLVVDPSARLNSQDALSHPWVASVCC